MTPEVRRALKVSAPFFVALAILAVAVAHRELGGWDRALYLARLQYIHHIPPLGWPQELFTPDDWKRSPVDRRYRFAKSLLADKKQIGESTDEVARILGGDIPSDATQWLYPLKRCGFQNLWWVVVVEFKNGHVSGVRRAIAWLDP